MSERDGALAFRHASEEANSVAKRHSGKFLAKQDVAKLKITLVKIPENQSQLQYCAKEKSPHYHYGNLGWEDDVSSVAWCALEQRWWHCLALYTMRGTG